MANWGTIRTVMGYLGFGSGKKAVGKAAEQITEQAQKSTRRMTRSYTDPLTGFDTLEREITYRGKEGLCRIERMPNGVSKISITGGGDNPMWRTKTITREKGGSVFGGDKVTINKEDIKYWCYKENKNLVKEYNKNGGLEHKELNFSHSAGNGLNDYSHKAVQDKVYNEYPLTNSADDMLKKPSDNRYIKHSLDGTDNYGTFADKESTAYSRVVAAREQAAIDAAKKAKEEAAAAKAAAEKAAAELKAKQPRINIGKAFGRNVDELAVKETTLANGTVERVFSDPKTGKILAKTQDLGIGHKEWIYGAKGSDMIFMSQAGKDTPYIVAKKGNYTQIRKPVNEGSKKYETISDSLYYSNGKYRYKVNESKVNDNFYAEVKIPYNETPFYKNSSKEWQEHCDKRVAEEIEKGYRKNNFAVFRSNDSLDRDRALCEGAITDAKENFLDLQDLFSAFKA